jgi:transposase InsO family protein
MCKLAGVSRSGYYNYVKNRNIITDKEFEDQLSFMMIKNAYEYKGWKKGARQIKMRIKRNYGVIMNLKKIRRLMRKYDLVCPIRKINPIKAEIKKKQSHKIHGNILSRNFGQGIAKKILLTDITYITYGNGQRAYLSVIKDATTKMILAWKISLSLDLTFVIDTVKQLLENYKGELDMHVMIHSDQGCHYTSIAYQELLKENGIIQSMSRKGNCWDNAPQESFFAILKTEMDLKQYKSYLKMGLAIVDYINYYNYDRPQLKLNQMTPYEYDEYLSNKFSKKLMLPALAVPEVIYL